MGEHVRHDVGAYSLRTINQVDELFTSFSLKVESWLVGESDTAVAAVADVSTQFAK